MPNNERNDILEELKKINKRISLLGGYLKELELELSLPPALRKPFRKHNIWITFFFSLIPLSLGIFMLSRLADPKVNVPFVLVTGTLLILASIAMNILLRLGVKNIERQKKALKESQLEDGLE
jgi:hypothetical protein